MCPRSVQPGTPPTSIDFPAALAAAVECGNGKPGGNVAKLALPVTGIAAVAVEHEQCGMGLLWVARAQQFGMDAGAARPREVEVRAFRVGGLKVGRYQFHIRVGRSQFSETGIPIVVEVSGSWVGALIGRQLIQGHIK